METQLSDAKHLLSGLRDVEGVIGSAVFSTAGRSVARDFPAYVDATALDGAGERLARISDAISSKSGELPERMVLRFKEHKLFVQAYAGGMLAILSATEANMAALKMAANLVTRRMPVFAEPAIEEAPPPEPSAPAVEVEVQAFAPEPIQESTRPSRPVYFRGRRVE